MKKFKQIDAGISAMLITIFFIASLINQDYTFITGYIVVGAWQVLSMLVHLFHTRYFPFSGMRSAYNVITLISLITMPIGSIFILLFTAPFMAIFYTWMCFNELRKMNERPLDILK